MSEPSKLHPFQIGSARDYSSILARQQQELAQQGAVGKNEWLRRKSPSSASHYGNSPSRTPMKEQIPAPPVIPPTTPPPNAAAPYQSHMSSPRPNSALLSSRGQSFRDQLRGCQPTTSSRSGPTSPREFVDQRRSEGEFATPEADGTLTQVLQKAASLLDSNARRSLSVADLAALKRIAAHLPQDADVRPVWPDDHDPSIPASTPRPPLSARRMSTNGMTQPAALNVRWMETVLEFTTSCARASITDTLKIIQTIQKEIIALTSAKAAFVWMHVAGAELLVQNQKRLIISVSEKDHLVGEAFRTGQTVQLGPTCAIPMSAMGNVLAVIEIVAEEAPDTVFDVPSEPLEKSTGISPRMTTLGEALASIGALFLQNAALYEDLSKNKEQTDAMFRMAKMLSQDSLDEEAALVEAIVSAARQLCDADRCSVFIVREQQKLLRAHMDTGNTRRLVEIPLATGIAGHVARTGDTVNIRDAYNDPRFNREVDRSTGYHTKTILCMPVSYEGKVVAVAQLINKQDMSMFDQTVQRVFSQQDELRFMNFSAFIGVCLRNCRSNSTLRLEKARGDAILDVASKLTTTDIRRIDGVIRYILEGARRLLRADRASLFLLDKERGLLCSKAEHNTEGIEIEVELKKGIVGQVASTGEADRVDDAYEDPRFNKNIDRQLGYHTTSLITEPIFSDGVSGEVVAVMQLVNKIDEDTARHIPFSLTDHDMFRQFALFAGMALSNAHLLEFAVRAGEEAMQLTSMTKRRTSQTAGKKAEDAASVLSVVHRDYERAMVLELSHETLESVTDLQFDLFRIRRQFPDEAADVASRLACHLIWSTGLPLRFNCSSDTLLRFVLACRRKYRQVPYHNFFHAVDVCQTIYCFLYHGKTCDLFEPLECYVLLITALVHDLDHMGLNNSYHMKTSSPLGILSSASGNNSVLEVHHCSLAIEIMEEADLNVFGGLDQNSSTAAIRGMIECVLATDMARHAEFSKAFARIGEGGETPFVRDNADHRRIAMQQLLKAADISNVTKNFELSKLWGMSVTEEFYRQGDLEREAGVDVLPMNDRSLQTELAKGQLGFINFLAEPFFKLIVDGLFHGMRYTTDQIAFNKQKWSDELELSAIARKF